ncbi:hypothetical protein BGX27_009094 [Mortierella sp. AM989]|nr:hypothetical protein BGX27_009094 [Mortierella sp. AM989]
MAKETPPQHIPMTSVEKETEDKPVFSSASSTTPVQQLDSFDTIDDRYSDDQSRDPPSRNLKKSLPQFFVLPHLFTKNAWILLGITTAITIIYIWLYLGSLWNPFSRVKSFSVVIYNGDAGFDYTQTPQQLTPVFQAITGNSSLGSLVEKQIMDPQGVLNHVVTWIDKSQETWDRDSLLKLVDSGDVWGVVYIPTNFSSNFLSYAPTNAGPATAATVKPAAFEYIFDQGRSYGTHSILEKAVSRSMEALCKGFERNLLASPANQTLLQNMHPSLWIQAISMTETVMHPVLVYGQNFATYVSFIVLYIGAVLTVYTTSKFLPNTVETIGVLDGFENNYDGPDKTPRPTKFPALRIALARFNVGAIFSTIHCIFIWMTPQVMNNHQISDKYNAGIAFAFIWMVGKAFNSVLFLMAQVLTVDGFQIPATVFMLLMFTSSGGILDWTVMPGFFRIGKAFPFTYAVKGMKTIYFGTLTDDMWINWVAISAWIVVPLGLTLILARSDVRLRREEMRQKSRAQSAIELQ